MEIQWEMCGSGDESWLHITFSVYGCFRYDLFFLLSNQGMSYHHAL